MKRLARLIGVGELLKPEAGRLEPKYDRHLVAHRREANQTLQAGLAELQALHRLLVSNFRVKAMSNLLGVAYKSVPTSDR